MSLTSPEAAARRRRLYPGVAVAAVIAIGVTVAGLINGPEGNKDRQTAPGATGETIDPLVYRPALDADYEARATAGYSHVLYAKSPGGVFATARRVDQLRPLVEAATRDGGVDADTLEAVVFLESGGRPDVIAGGKDPANASGLAQIVAETGQSLLAMHVDLAALARPDQDRAARGGAGEAQGGPARAGAAPGRGRALRAAQGPGRRRALPHGGAGALRPRRPRARLLPHGDRQPRPCRRRVRRRAALLRAPVLRLDAAAPRGRMAPAVGLRRRLLDVLLAGAGGQGDHAPVSRGTRDAPAARRAPDEQGVIGGDPSPGGGDEGLPGAGRRREGPRRRVPRRPAGEPGAPRLPHRPAHGRAGPEAGSPARALPRATSRRRCARPSGWGPWSRGSPASPAS